MPVLTVQERKALPPDGQMQTLQLDSANDWKMFFCPVQSDLDIYLFTLQKGGVQVIGMCLTISLSIAVKSVVSLLC